MMLVACVLDLSLHLTEHWLEHLPHGSRKECCWQIDDVARDPVAS